MISAKNVKAMKKLIKTRNKRSGGSVFTTTSFYKTYLQDKYNKYERGMYFSLDFGWYSIHFDIVC